MKVSWPELPSDLEATSWCEPSLWWFSGRWHVARSACVFSFGSWVVVGTKECCFESQAGRLSPITDKLRRKIFWFNDSSQAPKNHMIEWLICISFPKPLRIGLILPIRSGSTKFLQIVFRRIGCTREVVPRGPRNRACVSNMGSCATHSARAAHKQTT
jgi:hypothetical protein